MTFNSTIELCKKYTSIVYNSKTTLDHKELYNLQTNLSDLIEKKSFKKNSSHIEVIKKLLKAN